MQKCIAPEHIIFGTFLFHPISFRQDTMGIVEALHFGRHIFYPACVHQFLSPNDNALHGVAKAKWRGVMTDFDDDVTASVALMKCLDDVPADTIRSWWQRNLFLSGGIPREAQVKELICTRPSKWVDLHNLCIAEYKTWTVEEGSTHADNSPNKRRRKQGLDGKYWMK